VPEGAFEIELDRATSVAHQPLRHNTSTTRLVLLALAAFLIGILVTLAHKPFSQPEGGDEAIWDYVAQCIVRGQVPYRDVVEIKAPLSAYLSAGSILIGRRAGLSDVISIRLLNILMAGLLSAITFLVGVKYLRSTLSAWIAFLIVLVPTHFTEWIVAGTEPKLPMILFGMLSVYFIATRMPFWSGLFSMLSCLCWQPGLMFTAVAVLIFSKYLTNWRNLAAAKVLLGAVIPLAALLIYFYSVGALSDFWFWTIVYNLKVYAPETAKGVRERAGLLTRVLIRVFKFDLLLVACSLGGFIWFVIARIQSRREDNGLKSERLFKDAIVILPCVYFAFCWINFQSGPDLVPLFPFGGLFAAFFIAKLGRSRLRNANLRLLLNTSIAVLLLLILIRSLTYRVEAEQTLHDQENRIASISNMLSTTDKILVHGTVEILVLLNRPNLNPYVDLRQGKDEFVAQRTPGGFNTLVSQMEDAAPKIVAFSRAGRLHHREELRQWITDHYDPFELAGFEGIYLRRQR
jgi:hypothetical protein